MRYKLLAKFAIALILAAAAFALTPPPAHAFFPCGTETFVYSGGGRCTFNCETGRETCTGSLTGTVKVLGACSVC